MVAFPAVPAPPGAGACRQGTMLAEARCQGGCGRSEAGKGQPPFGAPVHDACVITYGGYALTHVTQMVYNGNRINAGGAGDGKNADDDT